MRKALAEALARLDTYPEAVRDALMQTRSDEDEIDVIGRVKSVERRYKPYIQQATAELELEPGVPKHGEHHTVEVTRAAQRSYNTANLLRLMQDNGITIMDLVDHGVIDIKWRWTELDRFTNRRGIELTKVSRELTPLGDEEGHVGEVWGTSYPRWS